MQGLLQQNETLKKSVEDILQQIQQQKELNQQHEDQIETLLKFNQRLLSIIENEISNKKDSMTLHPISERSERESDLIGNAMNSLIKTRKIGARSERGPSTTGSLVGPRGGNLASIGRQRQQSQLGNSFDHDDLSEHRLQQKTAYPNLKSAASIKTSKRSDIQKAVQNSVIVKQEMNKQISDLKKFKNQSMKFYDKKISEIKGLSSKLSQYQPMEQLKQISQKLTLSAGTSELIRRTMERNLSK